MINDVFVSLLFDASQGLTPVFWRESRDILTSAKLMFDEVDCLEEFFV